MKTIPKFNLGKGVLATGKNLLRNHPLDTLDQLRHRPQPQYSSWEAAVQPDALRRAWLTIKQNKGTGGPDGVTVQKFEKKLDQNLTQLSQQLLALDYRPRQATQVLVPKSNGDWRPLTLWTIRDRVAQRAVYNYLAPTLDPCFLPCSYGFRPGRSTANVAQAIHKAKQQGFNWVLDADIKDCFGQMQNQILIKQLHYWRVPPPVITLLSRWLKAKVWNDWHKKSGEAGTSQGAVISPLLCNIYLHNFDRFLMRDKRFYLVRYADDFVILTKTEKATVQARARSQNILRHIGLEIHPQKTAIKTFDEGFKFVGWFFTADKMYRL
jgi:group II intron reverse transcriptase/maturase